MLLLLFGVERKCDVTSVTYLRFDEWLAGAPEIPLAFRGWLVSLLAPARGMPTLPAKGGFSRPSLLTRCGVSPRPFLPQESRGISSAGIGLLPLPTTSAIDRSNKVKLQSVGVFLIPH